MTNFEDKKYCIACQKESPFSNFRHTPPYGYGFSLSNLTVCGNERHCDSCLRVPCPECQNYQSPPIALDIAFLSIQMSVTIGTVLNMAWTILHKKGLVDDTTHEQFVDLLTENYVDRWEIQDCWIDQSNIITAPFNCL